MKPKKGDVLFVWGNGPIQEAVEFITNGPAHCAIFIDENTVAEANAGRKTGTEDFSFYLNDKSNHLEIWRDETLTEEEIDKMVDFAKDHFGIPYAYTTILAELVHYELGVNIDEWDEGNKRICSTYVNQCAQSVKHQWTKAKLPAPVDLQIGGILKRKEVRESCHQNTLMLNALQGLKQG